MSLSSSSNTSNNSSDDSIDESVNVNCTSATTHTELMHNTRIVAFAASWATVLTKSVLHPLDTVKCRTQVYLSKQYNTTSFNNTSSSTSSTNNNLSKKCFQCKNDVHINTPGNSHAAFKTNTRQRYCAISHNCNFVRRSVYITHFYFRRALADWHGMVRAYSSKWGLYDLYGGLPIKLILYVPYQTAYMTGYNVAKNTLHTREKMQAEVDAIKYDKINKMQHNTHTISKLNKSKSIDKNDEYLEENVEVVSHTVHSSKHNMGYIWRTIVAALAAEFTSCLIRVPMEVIKTRIQTSTVANTQDAIKQLHFNGWRSCVRLMLPQTLMHDVPYSVIQWTVYESLRMWLMRWHDQRESFLSANNESSSSELNTQQQEEKHAKKEASFVHRYRTELMRSFCSGGFSGLIASICTVPVDNIRTRMIVMSASEPNLKISSLIAYVYRVNGIRGFYRGGAMRILWVTTNMAFYFPLFECFRMAALAHPERLGIHTNTNTNN